VVIGSQSILASYPEVTLPDELTVSIEAELLPPDSLMSVSPESTIFGSVRLVLGHSVSNRSAPLTGIGRSGAVNATLRWRSGGATL